MGDDAMDSDGASEQVLKKRRIQKRREEVAKEYEGEDIADTTPEKGFVTMRNRRAQNERKMRETQKMIRKKRKEKAADRAAEPKARGVQKTRRSVGTIVVNLASVDTTHEELCKTLKGDRLDTYMHNYHEFTMKQAQAMVEAEKLDKEDMERKAREKERKIMSDLKKEHVAKFTPTLKMIAFEVPHGTTLGVRGVVGQPKSNITSYFGLRTGSYVSSTERKWRKFYHETVKVAESGVYMWPDVSPSANISVTQSSSSKSTSTRMFCKDCNVGLEVDMKHGDVLCPKCGVTKAGGEGVGVQVSFSQQQATQKGAAPYERIAHVSNIVLWFWYKRVKLWVVWERGWFSLKWFG